MTIAAAQANAFYEEVAREGRLFTFTGDGEFLVFRINDVDVIPFWSKRSRAVKVQETHPKYRQYEIDETSILDFYEKTLPLLKEERISVGVNWSGKKLTGYDVPVSQLKENLDYWRKKLSP